MTYTASAVLLLLVVSFYFFTGSSIRVPESWRFLVKGRRMLLERAKQHKGAPFSLLIPGNRLHLVSSKEHWNDLNNASIDHLSSHAWSKQHFQPKYTFGYEWPDRRAEEGMPVVRAIRTLTNQFAELKKKFVVIMRDELNETLNLNARPDGTSSIPLWETVKHFASRMNILMMFGDDVANNSKFVDRGLKYIDEVTLVSEAAKSFPSIFVPILAWLVRGRNLNAKYVMDTISSEIKRHRDTKISDSEVDEKPRSILEALVRNLPEESQIGKIKFDMNTTFVSSTTATPIIATHLIQDIFTHPEYLPALRDEVKDVLDDQSPDMTKLPLLESFLVESIRTHCFLSTVVHRVPLKSFTFSDGYTVPKDDIVEFYQHSVMYDESLYPNPGKFDPSRFKGTNRAATDMGMEWPFWGNSKLACPGRFHVTNVAKLIAIFFIMNFDCEFESTSNLNFEFRDVSVPSPSARLVMKKRDM